MPQPLPERTASFRRVLYAVSAGLLLMFLLVSGYSLVMLSSVREQAESESLAAVRAQAKLGVLFVADHQRNLLSRLAAITSRNSFKQALISRDDETLRGYLNPLTELGPEVAGAYLTDPRGRVLLAVPPDQGRLRDITVPEAAASRISPVQAGPDGAMVTLSVPARGPDKGLLGFLAVRQRPVLWQRYFSNLSARPGRSFLIFDQAGNLVASGPGQAPQDDKAFVALAGRVRDKAVQASGAVSRLEDIPGGDRKAFVSGIPVRGLGWVLVVMQDYAQAMVSANALSQNIWLFLLVLLLCQVLLGFLLASRYRMQQHSLMRADELARGLEALVQERTADLAASTDRYRSLLEDLPDMVYEVDAHGRITLASGAARSILGYEPEEMNGRPFRDFVLPEDRDKFDEEKSAIEQGQEMSILALRHLTKDGRVRWLSIHSRGVSDGHGRVMGRRGVTRDVTQQVLAEKRVGELSGKLINAQEEERKRLALDLHDELGQLLSALKIGMQSLAKAIPPGEARELERLIRLSQTIMDRVRALAYNLRPAILDNFGLAPAVQDLCDSLAEAGLLQVECRLEDMEGDLPLEVKLSLFRCVQEALNNVVKHSHSSWAEVTLARRDGAIHLAVRDYGRGFDPAQAMGPNQAGRHLGLLGMHERLRLIGGRLDVQSSDQGTTLAAEAPLGEVE